MGEISEEIFQKHDFKMDTLKVAKDHVHIFLSSPPSYSISKAVEMLKSISASVIFEEHPEVMKDLWGEEFWEAGYFTRTVGDKVMADVIRKYTQHHREQERSPKQFELL